MTAKLGIRILIGFLFAVVGGFVCNCVLGTDLHLSFIAGLLLFASSELFLVLIAYENLERTNNAAISIASALPEEGRFSDFFAILLLSSLRRHARRMLVDGIEINRKEEAPRVWTECISQIETSLVVTSYILPSYWWKKGYAEPTIEIQKRKVAEGKKIIRIFLWENDEEFQTLRDVAVKQKEGKIIVKHAQYKDIMSDKKIATCLKRVGTADVAVIDNNWVVLHFLDKKRDTKSITISRNPEKVEASREFLGLLQLIAKDF